MTISVDKTIPKNNYSRFESYMMAVAFVDRDVLKLCCILE